MKLKQGYIDDKGVGHIPLTQGKWALCDAHWFHHLSQFNWHANFICGHWYGKRTGHLMHRLIMGVTDPKIKVDHKNREATLDNREDNLRIATFSQNMCNRGLFKNNKSGFKNVYWAKDRRKWRAFVQVNNTQISLGQFNTAVEAAAVYNWAAKKFHGEFASLNDLSQITEVQLEAA